MRVTVDAIRDFDGGKSAVSGNGVLCFIGGAGGPKFVIVKLARQRMVDDAKGFGIAAHDGEIGFVDLLRFEAIAEDATDRAVEREEQYTGGAAVEAMDGMDVLADLVAHDLHGKACFVAIEYGAVHE